MAIALVTYARVPTSLRVEPQCRHIRSRLIPAGSYEFASLAVDFDNLKFEAKETVVVPISTGVGMTGAVLIGDGTYRYAPAAGKSFHGSIPCGHAAV